MARHIGINNQYKFIINDVNVEFDFTVDLNQYKYDDNSITMGTHFSSLTARKREVADAPTPTSPTNGEFFYDTTNERMAFYDNDQWRYVQYETTTSTSSSTTSTSSSTTSTSSSTSRSTSSSTSRSTSTTTTL